MLAECASDGSSRALRVAGLEKYNCEGVEQVPFELRARIGHLYGMSITFQPFEAVRQLDGIRQGPPQQRDNLLDRLRSYRGIPGGSSFPDQETHVPHDAVAHFTEARQMNEEPFLKERGQLRIEITGFRELPQLLYEGLCGGS